MNTAVDKKPRRIIIFAYRKQQTAPVRRCRSVMLPVTIKRKGRFRPPKAEIISNVRKHVIHTPRDDLRRQRKDNLLRSHRHRQAHGGNTFTFKDNDRRPRQSHVRCIADRIASEEQGGFAHASHRRRRTCGKDNLRERLSRKCPHLRRSLRCRASSERKRQA